MSMIILHNLENLIFSVRIFNPLANALLVPTSCLHEPTLQSG